MNYEFKAIGIVHSCFKEKFGVPRQAGLAPDADAVLELLPPWDRPEAVRELEDFSHLWLVFVFHLTMGGEWRPTVRPPRLGGNKRMGVFATRSPYRPNPIGLSAVELVRIEQADERLLLHLRGADLVDGTPVLDVKPYVPYADAISSARGGFAQQAPVPGLDVVFAARAAAFLETLARRRAAGLSKLIVQVLAQDPRPAYMDDETGEREFGMRLDDYNVRWRVENGAAVVNTISIAAQ